MKKAPKYMLVLFLGIIILIIIELTCMRINHAKAFAIVCDGDFSKVCWEADIGTTHIKAYGIPTLYPY